MSQECIFCKIVAGEIPADVVHRDDRALAFRDLNPQAPVHVLVIPTEHHANAAALARTAPELMGHLVTVADTVAAAEGLAENYRLVANTGAEGGQVVFHLHLHLLGGRQMGWPPG